MSEIPVVLLHGVGLDHTMWQPLREYLAAAKLTTHALDLPGHGAEPPLREPQSLASLAADVLQRMPAEPVHLVGFSLGALIAQHIARYAPERVHTLTAVNSVCMRNDAEHAQVLSRLRKAEEDLAASFAAAISRWYPPEATTVSLEIVTRTAEILAANDPQSYLHAYRVFVHGDRELADELGKIQAPSLAITGELDPGSTPEMSQRLGQALPNARVVIVPGTRHMMPVETPEVLAHELLTLIAASHPNNTAVGTTPSDTTQSIERSEI